MKVKLKTKVSSLINAYRLIVTSGAYYFYAIFVIQLLNVIFSYLLLYVEKELINNLQISLLNINLENSRGFLFLIILSAFLTIFMYYINILKGTYVEKQQLKNGQFIDRTMMNKVLSIGISQFDNPKFYDKILLALESKSDLYNLPYRVMDIISNTILFLITIIVTIYNGYILPVLLVITLSIPALFSRYLYFAKQIDYENKMSRVNRERNYLTSTLSGKQYALEVRYYDLSNFFIEKYNTLSQKYQKGISSLTKKVGFLDSVCASLPDLGVLVGLVLVVYDIVYGNKGIGTFTYCLGIFINLKNSFDGMIESLARLNESSLSIQNYDKFFNIPEDKFIDEKILLDELKCIEFINVTFKYPNSDNYALKNINLKIESNQKVGLIGVNGSGKTTIINLLLRFYEPSEGKILINGINIQRYSEASLRKKFSLVFQDYIIYPLTLRENITFSDTKSLEIDKRIVESLKNSELYNDLFENSNINLDIHITRDFYDNGIELSMGQKQKLAIARGIYKNASFLIMDEPDASLDPESENKIISKINSLYKDKGLLMISHRLSNTKFLDYIIVLDNGKIIEQGSHRQLMGIRGKYYKLFKLNYDKYR